MVIEVEILLKIISMNNKYAIPLILIMPLLLSSCKLIFGIKNPRLLNDDEIKKYAIKYGIPLESVYKLDTLKYRKAFQAIKQSRPLLYHDVYQPLQVKGFDSVGKMTLFLINCNIQGGLTLKWDFAGTFDVFPPQQNYIAKVDTVLSLDDDIKFYQSLKGDTIDKSTLKGSDYTLIVFWSRFMNRQSKNLIQVLLNYQNHNNGKKIKELFINVDNLYKE